MYFKRKEVISGNKIKLIEDLEYLLNEEGFNTIIRFNQAKEQGKVFFANRGTTYWSFNCTNYQNLNSEIAPIEYDSNDENADGYKTGGFKMFINSGYDANQTVSTQPKNSVGLAASGIAAIPRNDIFSYEIYSTIDGWDWGIITKFEDMTFFTFFGDKSKGTELVGNYSVSSFAIGSARISIPYDFNNELSSIVSGSTPISPFEGVQINNSVFFCYYSNNLQTEVTTSVEMNVQTRLSGDSSQNAPKGIYKNFYNEYSGLSQIVNLEVYVNNPNGESNTSKKLYDFDFGYANLNKANSLDTKTINGERIKFIVNGRKEKVMNINNRASYNNLIFWFKVK